MHLSNIGPVIRQYAVVIIVNLNVLCVGLGLAWTSPALVKLRNSTESILSEPLTEEQGSWIVSIGFLVGIAACFPAAYLLDRIGRKNCVLLTCIPKALTCLIFTFATEYWMLVVARALNGIWDTMIFAVAPMYASEIASKEIRGALGTIFQISCSIGVLIVLCVGPFISYLSLNVLILCIVTVSTIPQFFIPDSPYFLYSKGKIEETTKVLISLRGSEALAKEELKEYEISNEKVTVNKTGLYKNRIFLKAFGIVLVLGAGAQLSGFNAISFYLQTILESTKTSIKPEISSVVIGFIQLSASLFTTFVTDRFGRKPILTTTLVGMAIGMVGLGAFFYVRGADQEISGFMNFVPLISLILVVFCFSAGIGSLFWIISSELFDGSTRAVGVSLGTILTSIFLFLTSKYFAIVSTKIGPAASYWVFSTNCVLLCLFIIFCIPETKGKSFYEIQTALGAKRENHTAEKA